LGETFELRNQGAHDIRRYDVVKDIARLEEALAAEAADIDFAVIVNNDPGYWQLGLKVAPPRGGATSQTSVTSTRGTKASPPLV
jgi:hypothetical protein